MLKKMPLKALSFFLALLIVTVSVPFAFATDIVALSASNVTEWPTTQLKNEVMYFGQTVGDCVLLNGGKVEYNGSVVPGHFEFLDPKAMATTGNVSVRADLKFVPDDETSFVGFESKRNRNVTYYVTAVTPLFVDEENDPVIATEVESGSMLSTSILSGGKLYNPYNADEPNIQSATWMWSSSNTVINESGYYEAFCLPKGYNKITAQVYVRIAGEIPETTITEAPTVPADLKYDGVTTWGDIPLEGGKAELKVEGTAVEGTFAVTDYWKTRTVNVGSYEIDVVFTPADPEAALPYSLKIPVTVNKAPIRFVDENGNDIVPEITVPYGTDFNYIPQLLKPYVKGAEYTLISLGDLENTKVTEGGTYTVTASAPDDGAHYEKTELSFKIIIEKQKLNPKLYAEPGKLYIQDTSGTYRPEGTFTFTYYINDVEQGSIEGIKYLERFDWNPTKSGNYRYEIVYVEATENEHYIIEPFNATNPLTLSWAFKAPGAVEGTQYPYGSEVALEAPATDPEKADKPYYGFVKWEDVNGNTGLTEEELANREITFTMPDGEVELKATYEFDFCLFIQYYVQIVVDWFNSFFQSLGTLF